MKKWLLLFLFFPFLTSAAPDPSACISQLQANFTCYAPGRDPKIEGPFETSKPGLRDTGSIPTTLDDVRLAAAQGIAIPVTLAMNPIHYGKYYNLGDITYTSAIDGKTYPMKNVMGYVHDTGCAFWPHGSFVGKQESCCLKYNNTCPDVYRKIDIAHGDYRPYKSFSKGGLYDVNNGPACAKINKTVCQIAGPLTTPPTVGSGTLIPGNDQRMSLANLQTGGLPGVTTAPGVTRSPQISSNGFSNQALSTGGTPLPTTGTLQSPQLTTQLSILENNALTGSSGTVPEAVANGFIFTQPAKIRRGDPLVLAWSTLGSISLCGVTMRTTTGLQQEVARQSSGTRIITTAPLSISGIRTFVLSCMTPNGVLERTATSTIE